MAEGFLRAWASDRLDVSSAGTEATGVHPLAVRVMAEMGIDLAGHRSKTVDTLLDRPWDYVVTVCDDARERCPVFPQATTRLHWSFEDPSSTPGDEGHRLAVFRRVRDQIAARLLAWLASEAPLPDEDRSAKP
jgi:arsenate reductase